MIMLISFVGTLARTTMGAGRMALLPSKGPIMGSICLLNGNSQVFIICVIFSIIISGGSAFYFIEIVMLISFEYPRLKQLGLGRVTLPNKGPIKDQYVFVMAKSQSFYCFRFFFFS